MLCVIVVSVFLLNVMGPQSVGTIDLKNVLMIFAILFKGLKPVQVLFEVKEC
jgi:hypothetical protein